jgi:predicted PurR-regulated permease PerM
MDEPLPPNNENGTVPTRSRAVTGLFVLGLFYTAYFAAPILIPITMALLMSLVLSPLVRLLNGKLYVPRPLAAIVVLLGFIIIVLLAFYLLAAPATKWMGELPDETFRIERKLHDLIGQVHDVQDAAKQVEDLAQAPQGNGDKAVPVVVQGPSLAQLFLGHTMAISLSILVTLVLLLFLLFSGETLLRQAVTAAPRFHDKKHVVEIVREIELDVSHYLLSISLINAGLGICIGVAMALLGMPNPTLWGAMAAVFNFIPFVGPLVGMGIMALVALITFDSWVFIAAPPLIYLLLHAIESEWVTPVFIARRLALNPVAVLLSLILWGWLWGIPGTLMAIPMLATFKIVAERIDSLHVIGIMIGSYDSPNGTKT